MNVLQEIIHEAKLQTHVELQRNSKRLLVTLGIVSSLMSITFYILGFPYQDSFYREIPYFAGIPLLAMASFNAFGFVSIATFFLVSLGEVTSSTIKHNLEQRKDTKIKTNSKAIYDRFNEFGQRDFSLQIDEAKQGFKHEISEIRTDLSDWKKFTSDLARRFSLKSLVTDKKIARLESEVIQLREEVRILKESKKQEEQMRNKKIGIQNNTDTKSDKLKDIDDAK